MKFWRTGGLLAIGLCAMALSTQALAEGDPANGRKLAIKWCSNCHLVDEVGGGNDAAPPFTTVAKAAVVTPERLRGWLLTPHPNMPQLDLTLQEIEDLVAYLQELDQQ